MGTFNVIKADNIMQKHLLIVLKKLRYSFYIHHLFNAWYNSLQSAILIPDNSFVILINILLFKFVTYVILNIMPV